MIGVDGVGVVRGDHHAVGQADEVIFCGSPKSQKDPGQRIVEEGGGRPLSGAASDFFVVKYAVEIQIPFFFSCKKTGKGSEGALEIIQPLKGESIWRDFLQTHGPGIHHLKFSVDHLSPADEYLRGQGFACVQQGAAVGPNKGKTWAYYDLEGTLPLCIELMNEVIEQ